MPDPRLARYWDALARENALESILTRKAESPWDTDEFFATGRAHVARIVHEIERRVTHLHRQTALDFGCGVGRLTVPFAEHFRKVVGVDAAPAMIARARQMHADQPRCRFVVDRHGHLRRFRTGTFDLVHSALVLQHIPPAFARRYIAELIRVTAQNGVTVFQLPEPIEPDAEELFRNAPIVGSPLKRAIPRWVVRRWRGFKYRRIADRVPRMAMFGLARTDVVDIIRDARATLLDALDDRSHGTDVPGYLYIVRRSHD
jgi:SAM-dependent methyltransferase